MFTALTETLLLVSILRKLDYLNNRREFTTSDDRFEISMPISFTWANTHTFLTKFQTMLGPTLLLHITAYLTNHQEFFTFDYRFEILRPIATTWANTHTFWTTFQKLLERRLQLLLGTMHCHCFADLGSLPALLNSMMYHVYQRFAITTGSSHHGHSSQCLNYERLIQHLHSHQDTFYAH